MAVGAHAGMQVGGFHAHQQPAGDGEQPVGEIIGQRHGFRAVFQTGSIDQIALTGKDHIGQAGDFRGRVSAVAIERYDDIAMALLEHAAHGAAVALGGELPYDAGPLTGGDGGGGVAAAIDDDNFVFAAVQGIRDVLNHAGNRFFLVHGDHRDGNQMAHGGPD